MNWFVRTQIFLRRGPFPKFAADYFAKWESQPARRAHAGIAPRMSKRDHAHRKSARCAGRRVALTIVAIE
jgi:hypothetical protein